MSHNRHIQVVFYSTLTLSVVALALAVFLVIQTHNNYQHARAEHSDKVGSLHRSIDDDEWLVTYSALYQSYLDSGLIGETNRLLWLALLSDLHETLSIEDYQFEMHPPEVIPVKSGVSLHTMEISVYGRLPHDGVLADLLTHLDSGVLDGWHFKSLEVVKVQDRINQASNGLASIRISEPLEIALTLEAVSIVPSFFDGEVI